MTDLTPEDIEHFASGTMPHERPTEVDIYREQLRARIEALRDKGRTRDWDYFSALDDVLALIDGSSDG